MTFVAIIAYTLFYGVLPVMVQMPTCTKTASGICCEFTSSTYCCPHPLVPKSEAMCCDLPDDSVPQLPVKQRESFQLLPCDLFTKDS